MLQNAKIIVSIVCDSKKTHSTIYPFLHTNPYIVSNVPLNNKKKLLSDGLHYIHTHIGCDFIFKNTHASNPREIGFKKVALLLCVCAFFLNPFRDYLSNYFPIVKSTLSCGFWN